MGNNSYKIKNTKGVDINVSGSTVFSATTSSIVISGSLDISGSLLINGAPGGGGFDPNKTLAYIATF